MELRSSLSTAPSIGDALDEACAALGMEGPDLLFAFASAAHLGEAEELPERLAKRVAPRHLLGCAAQGVIGRRREVESGPALALLAARLPGASAAGFHVVTRHGTEGFSFDGLPDAEGASAILVLADPFSTPADRLVEALGEGAPVVGGVASAADAPNRNRLFLDANTHRSGCVGVVLRGVKVLAAVSQGCRPVGRPFVVTRASDNVIYTLAGRPALAQLREIFEALPACDRDLARRGLHLGVAIDEYKEKHLHGDFLVRNVMGADPRTGALAISDEVRVGQTVQFQVRDAESARLDLEGILRRAKARGEPRGALLFSCNGRGTNLFGETGVDARAVASEAGPIPLAGFFAAGEIGPVGRRSRLHGFTASLALFCA